MPTPTAAPYLALLNATVGDEPFVTQTFRLMEADLRVLALSALADWDAAGLHAAAEVLFQAVGALQRPAWGAWNGLLLSLAKARRTIAQKGDAATRKQLEQARVALAILIGLERKVDAALVGDCAPLIALAGHQGGLTQLQLLTLPIRLRNRAAHDGWTDPALWAQAAVALRPLVGWLGAGGPVPSLTQSDLHPEPFFLQRDGQWWAFNGIDQDGAIYVAPNGAAEVSAAGLALVLLLFQRVLGQTAEQEENFRKWVGRFAPEEVKGVLLGDFLVGRPVGRGGFATVHRGVQLSTGRQVAVKILHDGLPEEAKLRFQQEAAFLARCDHPHVVGVIGHGEGPWSAPRAYSLEGEDWYRAFARTAPVKTWIALEWVDGHTLEEYVKGTVQPAPDLARKLDWFLAAAEALVTVHANGLIHRDIKPGNLMVTETGALKLMDFGIARTQAEDRTIMTATGQGLGTPAYMAPEQIRAEEAALEVGPAADLYGLCATFYEVFTGTRLYHHDCESAETIRTQKLAGQLPPAPRTLAPGLEWELETILLGGLQPEPADRYRSAEALARDLQHVRNDEPIEYRRPSLGRRMRLAYRRNRTVFNTAGAFCVLIVLLTLGYVFKITEEQQRTQEQLIEARHNLGFVFAEKAERALPEHRLNEARFYALHALANFDPRRSGPAKATSVILSNPSYSLAFDWVNGAPHDETVSSVSFSPDGRTLASGSFDNTVRLWDAATGQEKSVLAGHTGWVTSVSFSPEGRALASGSYDNTVRLWDAATGQEKSVLAGHTETVLGVGFSPDGRTLASGSDDNTIRLWDAATGQEKAVLAGHTGGVASVRFSPDGRTLASGSRDDTVRLWDAATGQEQSVLLGHTETVHSVSFSPDGQTLASASEDKTVRLWDTATGQEKGVLAGHKESVSSVSFSPNGRTLASGSDDKTARLWDAATGQEKAVLAGHTGSVFSVSFSPDGRTLASGSDDNTVRLWDAVTGQEKAVPAGHMGSTSVSFSPDGRTLALGSQDDTVRLWDAVTGQEKAVLAGHTGPVASVSFSPLGRTLASGSEDQTVRLWDAVTGQQTAVLAGHKEAVTSVSFSPDGRTLASGAKDHTVRLWDGTTGQEKAVLECPNYVYSVSFSPDGRTLASGSEGDHTVRLWDAVTGREKATLSDHSSEPVISVSFSPDGRILASGTDVGTIRLWDTSTGQEKSVLRGHTGEVKSVSFSPDGRTLASGSWDDTVRLWDPATGQEKAVLLGGHTSRVNSVSFSPDGRTLTSGSEGHAVRLWDVVTDHEKAVLAGHSERVTSVGVSPDGRILASGSYDMTIRLWDAATHQEKAVLAGHKSEVTSVSFSPDGRTLASGSRDETVRLWDLATGQEKAVLAGHKNAITSVSFSPDGRTLASGSADDTVRLWDTATGQEKAVLAGHNMITSVSFSPDGRTLASGSRDETVRLWDLATGQEKAVLAGHKNAITSVSFSPDSRTLASGSWDKTVRLWDTATGQEKAVLTGHTGWIVSVSFSPDGRTLASGASENTVRLWDAATGQEKAVLEGNAEGVYSVSFSPDGRTLISGGGDKTIRLLDLSFLHDPRPSEEQLKAAERQYKLRLVNLELQPIPPERHLYRTRPPVPTWSESHPLHWLPAAERGDRQAMLQLGILYDRAHDLPLAETWYRQAAEAGDAEAQTQLADVRRRQVAALWKALPEGRITPSQFDQVLDLCNRVIALDPKDVEAYGRRAQILYLRNETRQAEADLRKVIDLAPEFEGAQGTLGWILITQGRFDEALPFATKAHTLAPDRSDWAINLGHVHLLTSDRQTARQYYEKTIPLIPDEAALKSGPLADLDLFIKKGWQVKACREEAAWLRKRFAEIHAKPH